MCGIAVAAAVQSPEVSAGTDDVKLRKFLFPIRREAIGLLKKQRLDCYAETDYPITECLIWCSGELHILVENLIFPFFSL